MDLPDPRTIECTVAILAGGKSERMGTDKSMMMVDGMPLLRRVLDRVQPLGYPLLLVTNTPDTHAEFDVAMTGDIVPDMGSLGGLYTAIDRAETDLVMVVACDMPSLDTPLITHQIHEADKLPEIDALVPRVNSQPQPLHAVYRKQALPAIKAQIDAGELRLGALLDRLRVFWMEEDEIRAYDAHLSSFVNLNTPQETSRHQHPTPPDDAHGVNPPSHL